MLFIQRFNDSIEIIRFVILIKTYDEFGLAA